jgi:hypothetical protein
MENIEKQEIEVSEISFENTSKKFIETVKTLYTNPANGEFVEHLAVEFLQSLTIVITQNESGVDVLSNHLLMNNLIMVLDSNPDSINVLENTEFMQRGGKYIGRNDLFKPDGDFNVNSIFSYAKEEFGADLKESLPLGMGKLLDIFG